MPETTARFAGVELGGTKTIAVLSAGHDIVDRLSVATTSPAETLGAVHRQLLDWHRTRAIDALGIASFGPVRLNRHASDFATILTTPKPGWTGVRLLDLLAQGLDCPVAVDTDVNAAALAEYRWGAGHGCSSLVYVTIGTGVGGGLLIEGRPIHGRLHPEIGHILTRRWAKDHFAGTCPFHGDCIEGLISGPALERRFGAPAELVPADAPEWDAVAHDLAQLLATLIHTLSPQRILVGGGVGLGAGHLIQRAIAEVFELLGAYYPSLDLPRLSTMIAAPGLRHEAGPMGAIALAQGATGNLVNTKSA